MKKLILFTICIIFINEYVTSQVEDLKYFSAIIVRPDAKPDGIALSKNTELNQLLKKNDVISYKISVSSIRQPEKDIKVLIECENCDSKGFIKALSESGFFRDISYYEAEPDYEPIDYMWKLGWLWHLEKIQADFAWDISKGDNEIIIAIIDTDFDVNHPDLTNKISPHYDPITLVTHSAAGSSHGTATSSFAGAETDGGGQLASVGFNTRIIAYKTAFPVDQAYHAAFIMGADIISYSFSGGSSTSPSDSADIKSILDSGVVIVRSAGNHQYNSDDDRHPFAHAIDSRIIIVSSTDENDNHTSPDPAKETHANFPEVDLCAPGYCLFGATPTIDDEGQPNSWPYYGCQTGTSFATPIVAGVCALMKEVNHCLSVSDIQDIITSTADPIADAHLYPGTVGTGRINANNSIKGACEAGTFQVHDEVLSTSQTTNGVYGISLNDVHITAGDHIFRTTHEVSINGPLQIDQGVNCLFDVDLENNIVCQ